MNILKVTLLVMGMASISAYGMRDDSNAVISQSLDVAREKLEREAAQALMPIVRPMIALEKGINHKKQLLTKTNNDIRLLERNITSWLKQKALKENSREMEYHQDKLTSLKRDAQRIKYRIKELEHELNSLEKKAHQIEAPYSSKIEEIYGVQHYVDSQKTEL